MTVMRKMTITTDAMIQTVIVSLVVASVRDKGERQSKSNAKQKIKPLLKEKVY